jgi:hypothetical protein
MNTSAPHQTRAIRKTLEGLPVEVNTMRQFPDTRICADELEVITRATVLLKDAGYKLSDVTDCAGKFYVYAVKG